MIKVGIADYGIWFYEGGLFDFEQRLLDLKSIGYDGQERLYAASPSDAIHKAAKFRKLGMDFATCLTAEIAHSIEWTAALGKEYVWIDVQATEFEVYCRQVNTQIRATNRYGLKTALHNHMGATVETQEQLLRFLKDCPEAGLILDTGHLGIAEGGDPVYIVENYFNRIVSIHLKDWVMQDPAAEKWHNRGYFCELGGGNFPIDQEGVVRALQKKGYDKWIFIEHETHLREPLEDLKHSRDVLKKWGV